MKAYVMTLITLPSPLLGSQLARLRWRCAEGLGRQAYLAIDCPQTVRMEGYTLESAYSVPGFF